MVYRGHHLLMASFLYICAYFILSMTHQHFRGKLVSFYLVHEREKKTVTCHRDEQTRTKRAVDLRRSPQRPFLPLFPSSFFQHQEIACTYYYMALSSSPRKVVPLATGDDWKPSRNNSSDINVTKRVFFCGVVVEGSESGRRLSEGLSIFDLREAYWYDLNCRQTYKTLLYH
jgi:hypothetical protein